MQIGIGLKLRFLGGVAFSPLSLFYAGEPGAWYDPSDLTTMFQDTAGATPVTAPGQTVALLLDKSGRGNHATQATSASRPTYGIVPLGGRRNLLTFTEQFDNAAWNKNLVTITANFDIAPDGTQTADRFVSSGGSFPQIAQPQVLVAGLPYTFSMWVKSDGTTQIAQVLLLVGVVTSFTPTSTWTRVSVSIASSAGGSRSAVVATNSGTAPASSFLIWGAQLETGSAVTDYQRVTTQYDVTETGVQSLSYLSFDGVDDGMVTSTITPGIDKAQVFAGVRKLSDAVRGTIVEHSANISSNNGSLHLTAPNSASATFGFESKGTILTDAVATFAAPTTKVITGIGDIAGDSTIIRANGTQQDQDTGDQGTGNYLAYPIYIGRRGGSSLPFNGQIYSLIVRFGTNLPSSQITSTETWVNGKTGAY